MNEAFTLNSPLIAVPVGGAAEDDAGYVALDDEQHMLGLGALKPALDGDGLILRLYEPYGARDLVVLNLKGSITSVERVNLLEDSVEGPPVELTEMNSTVTPEIKPFEIVTRRIRP